MRCSPAAARSAGGSGAADEMFLAGMIHDLGLMLERQAFPRQLAEVCRRCGGGEGGFLELERELVGVTHQDFGRALTAKWHFPERLRVAAGFHHQPERAPDECRRAAAILCCVDTLCCREGLGFDLSARDAELSPELLAAADVAEDQLTELRTGLKLELEEVEGILG